MCTTLDSTSVHRNLILSRRINSRSSPKKYKVKRSALLRHPHFLVSQVHIRLPTFFWGRHLLDTSVQGKKVNTSEPCGLGRIQELRLHLHICDGVLCVVCAYVWIVGNIRMHAADAWFICSTQKSYRMNGSKASNSVVHCVYARGNVLGLLSAREEQTGRWKRIKRQGAADNVRKSSITTA